METCQSLLGGAKSTADHARIQSAIQLAVRILDSIIYLTSKGLRKFILPKTAWFEEKLKVHKVLLCARHPPVFYEWFLRTFPDPTTWYSSRSAYCLSTAVMSVVGYILGLGDRHGENILFDSFTGECVHVHFNKGETFDVPEVVQNHL